MGDLRMIGDQRHLRVVGTWGVQKWFRVPICRQRTARDLNRQVARDARRSESVTMTSYVGETDREMRQRSNRTHHRILASMSPKARRRYGYVPSPADELRERPQAAPADARNGRLVKELATPLVQQPSDRGASCEIF
jgi:hypothetical protein